MWKFELWFLETEFLPGCEDTHGTARDGLWERDRKRQFQVPSTDRQTSRRM